MLPVPVAMPDAASLALRVTLTPFDVTLKPPRLMLLPACAVNVRPGTPPMRFRLVFVRVISRCAWSVIEVVRRLALIVATEMSESPPGLSSKQIPVKERQAGRGIPLAEIVISSGSRRHLPGLPFRALVSPLPDARSPL